MVKEVTFSEVNNLNDYLVEVREPIIFKGLAENWPMVKAANISDNSFLDYLKQHHEPMIVGTGSVANEHQGRLFYNQECSGFNFSRKSVAFDEFLDMLSSVDDTEQGQAHYMGSTNVDKLIPAIRADNDIEALVDENPLVSIWLSNKTVVAAHQDLPNNVAVCVAGVRRFTLFPPEQIENLYIGPIDLTPAGQAISLVDHRKPDFALHPKYKKALKTALVAELQPGDALLLPSLWWHCVESLAPINGLVNFWWQQATAGAGAPMDALMHGIMNLGSLSTVQKKAMKSLFDYYVFSDEPNRFKHIPEKALGVLKTDDELSIRKLRALLLNKLNQ